MKLDRLATSLAAIHGSEMTPALVDRLPAELDLLPGRFQEVLRARFGVDGDAPQLLADIATRYDGWTAERVRQMEGRALDMLGQRLFS